MFRSSLESGIVNDLAYYFYESFFSQQCEDYIYLPYACTIRVAFLFFILLPVIMSYSNYCTFVVLSLHY